MSVIDRIERGEIEICVLHMINNEPIMIISGFPYSRDKRAEADLLRLSKIGADRETELNAIDKIMSREIKHFIVNGTEYRCVHPDIKPWNNKWIYKMENGHWHVIADETLLSYLKGNSPMVLPESKEGQP